MMGLLMLPRGWLAVEEVGEGWIIHREAIMARVAGGGMVQQLEGVINITSGRLLTSEEETLWPRVNIRCSKITTITTTEFSMTIFQEP